MTIEDPHAVAARLEARTNRILLTSGTMFLIWQAAYFVVFGGFRAPLRSVDMVAASAMVAWAAALLMLVATGGGAFRSKEVRDILQDERARAHRATAYQNAFWAVMAVTFAAYIAANFTSLSAAAIAHMTLSVGVLVAVATAGYLNRP